MICALKSIIKENAAFVWLSLNQANTIEPVKLACSFINVDNAYMVNTQAQPCFETIHTFNMAANIVIIYKSFSQTQPILNL